MQVLWAEIAILDEMLVIHQSLMDVRATVAMADHAVYRHRWRRIIETLFITACSVDKYVKEKRT